MQPMQRYKWRSEGPLNLRRLSRRLNQMKVPISPRRQRSNRAAQRVRAAIFRTGVDGRNSPFDMTTVICKLSASAVKYLTFSLGNAGEP